MSFETIRTSLEYAILLIGVGGIIAVFLRYRHIRLYFDSSKDASHTSAIIAYYTAGHNLLNTGHGLNDGMHYGMYMTTPTETDADKAFMHEPGIIYVLDLPFNTQVHWMGLSKTYKIDRKRFDAFLGTTGMKQANIEGDFHDFFDIYVGTGPDFQVHALLDPQTLAVIEKYCKSHFWELHDSELYFVVPHKGIGNSNFIEESLQFIDAIHPALPTEDPAAPVIHHEVAYDIYDGPILSCPVCSKKMELQDSTWFRCIDGHGVLVTGRDLARLNHHDLKISMDAAKAVHHGPLTCPHCEHPMQTVLYQGNKKLEIDACTNCAFHWLDANEAQLLTTRKRWLGLF